MNSQKHIKTLELHRVLELLSEEATLFSTKEKILALKPSHNIDTVKRLLSETNEAYKLIFKFAAPSFGNAIDISSSLKRADVGASLSMRELLDISENLRVTRSLKAWRDNCDKTEETVLDGYFSALYPNQFLEDKINSAIKSEDEMNDRASTTLYDIRRKISAKSTKIRDLLDKTVHGPMSKYLQDAVITQRDGRFVVPVRQEYKANIKGIVHDTSSSGQTLFIEPMGVVEANNDIRVLKVKEEEEVARILAELSSSVADFSDSIRQSCKSLSLLDLIFAKAKLGVKMNASVPIVNSERRVNLIKARHPLIDKNTVVPIDINIGIDFNTLVITGPNTGGKTVALKTLGLLTLMAMCGLMIPVDDKSEICVFGNIFADIGDEQSIEQSLSTFSSHMVNIIDILKECDDNSLVLFDELCAGTDPVEGAALAKAILIELSTIGAKAVVTTHYPELKLYALETPFVKNASCEFDVKSLKPTYKLIIGMPGRSNAFAISKRLGLSERIIGVASETISDEEQRFENAVSNLEKARQSAASREREAEELKAQLQKTKNIVDSELSKVQDEQRDLMQKTREKASEIIDNARYKAGEMLNELEEIKKSFNPENASEMLKKAKSLYKGTISKLEDDSDPIENIENGEPLKDAPKPNDIVIIASLNQDATVINVDLNGNRAYVSAGSLKMWVKFEDLRIKKSSKIQKPKKKLRAVSGVTSRKDRILKSELDIRGMASDEGIIELDKYIDNAILSGVNTITIIHGKGTGVLRKAVHSHLRAHKGIKSFRVGVFGEGENGVTIAELKD